jgi:excisionase family DNA binding protein
MAKNSNNLADSEFPWRERITLRPDDVAKILGVHRSAVYRDIKEGKIPVQEVAGAKRVPVYWLLSKEAEWKHAAGTEAAQK